MKVGTRQVANMVQFSTGYFLVASGTTAQRPSPAKAGMMRFNTEFANFEYYVNGTWMQIPNNNYEATTAPTVNDDLPHGYAVGSTWYFGTSIYVCTSSTPGAAMWQEVVAGSAAHPGVASNRYYSTALDGMMSSNTFADNTLYAIPCQFPAGSTFNRIGVETISKHTNQAVRLGIYANLGGVPSSLLLDAGLVSSATVGVKEIVINFKTDGDWFWLVCNPQTDMILRSMECPSWVAGGALLGRLTSNSVPIMRVHAVQNYGAMPATFPVSKSASADDAPHLWLRKV